MEGKTLNAITTLGTCAEGMCAFGDKLYKVTLYDTNSNLRITDKFRPDGRGGGDFVYVQTDGWQAGNCYGKPVLVDGKLYDVKISEDGNAMTASEYTGPVGYLKTPHSWWSGLVLGPAMRMSVKGDRDAVPVPVGKYKLDDFAQYTGANFGKTGPRLLKLTNVEGPTWESGVIVDLPVGPDIEVRAGETTLVTIGSPIIGKLLAEPAAQAVNFRYTETDSAGQYVVPSLVMQDSVLEWRDATVCIAGPDGKPIDTVRLRWVPLDAGGATQVSANSLGSWQATWRPPTGVTGPFTATVQRDAGPFEVQAKPVTFSVK